MTLWKLEIARLVRTHRWLIVVGVYAFFGVLGPITARYMSEILARFGGEEFAGMATDPTPADGIGQFLSNAAQLGLLAVVVVAAAALAFDARPELAAFLRTRVARARMLVLPRYVVSTAAAAGGLIAGTAIAWVLTTVLIGSPSAGAIVVGTLYGIVYLAFAVAVVAAIATWAKSVVTTVFASIAVLLVLPAIGVVDAIAAWLPSDLLGAVAEMVAGAPASDYLRALVVALVLTAVLVGVALRRAEAREL